MFIEFYGLLFKVFASRHSTRSCPSLLKPDSEIRSFTPWKSSCGRLLSVCEAGSGDTPLPLLFLVNLPELSRAPIPGESELSCLAAFRGKKLRLVPLFELVRRFLWSDIRIVSVWGVEPSSYVASATAVRRALGGYPFAQAQSIRGETRAICGSLRMLKTL